MRANSLQSNGIEVVHTVGRIQGSGPETMEVPRTDGFIMVVQQTDYQKHTIWRSGRLFHEGSHPAGSVTVIDTSESWSCRPQSSFETVHFSLSNTCLREFALEQGKVPFALTTLLDAPRDPILDGLIKTFLPCLSDEIPHKKLLTDHLLEALKTHVSSRYAGLTLSARKGGLTTRQLKTALELLVSDEQGDYGVEELAAACGLSVSYFIRAFKRATGATPYQWLLDFRISKAQEMLKRGMPLAQVALECRFADQGHLSRVFKSKCGVSPMLWLSSIR